MKHFAYNSSYDAELFGLLLSPSWLSTTVGILSGLALAAYTVASSLYKGSETRLLFFHFQETQSQSSTAAIGKVLDGNMFVSNLPLLLFWCLVGLVVYMFSSNVIAAIQHAAQFNDELAHYAHLNRKVMIRVAVEKLVIRLAVLLVWVPYLIFFFHVLVPYVINLAFVASGDLTAPVSILYLVLATVIFAVGLYVHAVLFRLLLLRARVFGGAIYMS